MQQKIDLLNGIMFMEWNKNIELSIHLDKSLFWAYTSKNCIQPIWPFMNEIVHKNSLQQKIQ
jgi:hypothetical protein